MSRKTTDFETPGTPGCSSPPCYAADFPGYFGEGETPLDPAVTAGLNALLEAERAGAKVLAILREGLDAGAQARTLLDGLQKDEGANAVVLYKTIRRLGGVASHETGAFVGKTLAVDGFAARLAFLNKGQAWVVRKIEQLLPAIRDAEARDMLQAMHRSHLDNIAACEAFLAHAGGDPAA